MIFRNKILGVAEDDRRLVISRLITQLLVKVDV